MIKIINHILNGNEYYLEQSDQGLVILRHEDCCYEDFIEIKISKDIEIYEIHRIDRTFIISTNNLVFAGIYASILWLRLFQNRTDNETINTICDYAKLEDESKIRNLITKKLNSKYYSIGKEVNNKISLINKNGKFFIKYSHIYIVEGANLKQGYIALYNFSKILEFICVLYDKTIYTINQNINKQLLIELFLFGKIKN